MKSRNRNNICMLAVAVAFIVMFASSCASCRNKRVEAELKNQKDSIEQPQPLHPPVVIPHSWREEINNQE